jgi:hypothetical protein
LLINYLPFLAGCGFGWRCQQNSDYQPVGLHFASLPALSSLEPKRNLISLPVLTFYAYLDFCSAGPASELFGAGEECTRVQSLCVLVDKGAFVVRRFFDLMSPKRL